VNQLCKVKSTEFKDLERKLIAVKQGKIFARKADLDFMESQLAADSLCESIHTDKKYEFIKHSINYKYVFQMWTTQTFEQATLSVDQLRRIFPEFSHKLEIYQECCDRTGKIVRNFDLYKKYKAKDHFGGKRSGAKLVTEKQKKKAKNGMDWE